MKHFWLYDFSVKWMLSEFIKEGNPEATLWDIFTDYSLQDYDNEPANTSTDWLAQQDKLLTQMINTECATALNGQQIEDLAIAIQEFCYDENEQVTEFLDASLIPQAQKIVQNYLKPLALNDADLEAFLTELENRLREKNKEHILFTDKEFSKKIIGASTDYTAEQKKTIIASLENSWDTTDFEADDEGYDADVEDEETEEGASYFYPQLMLATSQTFFDYDDAGHLSYEEQEALVQKKYSAYVNEIESLLGTKATETLVPKKLDFTNDETNIAFETLALQHPLVYGFESAFTVWQHQEKLLFLTVEKEDKELPYTIQLGGMLLVDFQPILEAYNALVSL